MARIRTIKPEFPHSEWTGRVSRDARLLFVLLRTVADDDGRLRGHSRILASLLYPYDEDAPDLIDSWLAELEREKEIVRYVVDDATYLQIINWRDDQKIDRVTPSRLPPFTEASRILASPREESRESSQVVEAAREASVRDLDLDLEGIGSGSLREAPPKKRASAPPFDPSTVEGLDRDAWALWLEHRSAMKKPIRPHSMKDAAEALSALGDRQMIEVKRSRAGGWQGLHPEKRGANGSARAVVTHADFLAELERATDHGTQEWSA